MHRKFREKMAFDLLLDEIEETTNRIEDLHRSAILLNSYCKHYKHIAEIDNMLHITNSFEVDLLCLLQVLKHLVRKEKYNEPDFQDNIGKDFNSNVIIFEND